MERPFDDSQAAHGKQCALTEKKSGRKPSRLKARYIFLVVLALVIVTVGFFAYTNRDNISALYTFYAARKNGGDIQSLQEENDKKIQAILDSLTRTKIRDLTDEETEMLRGGELTEDEAIELITGNAKTVEEAKSIVRQRGSGNRLDTSQKDAIIAQIYVLRSTYAGQVDGLIAGAISEYESLSDSQRNASTKAAIADSLLARGKALEGQCDAQMEGLLSSLQAELQRLGEDTGIISQIRAAYTQEKRIKKAALIDSYY